MVPAATPISFQDLKKGMRIRVKSIISQCICGRRLQEMGLTKFTEFLIVKVAPFGDPIEIELRGSRFCLRRCDTCCFELEILEEPALERCHGHE